MQLNLKLRKEIERLENLNHILLTKLQQAEDVMAAARDVVADHEDDLPKHPQVVELAKALAAYDKTQAEEK